MLRRIAGSSHRCCFWAAIGLKARAGVHRCCRSGADFCPLRHNLVEQPLTRQADDADSWLREGLGQTPPLTSNPRFTDHQRHIAQEVHTCRVEHTLNGLV